mgnify:CR=1 FL=1
MTRLSPRMPKSSEKPYCFRCIKRSASRFSSSQSHVSPTPRPRRTPRHCIRTAKPRHSWQISRIGCSISRWCWSRFRAASAMRRRLLPPRSGFRLQARYHSCQPTRPPLTFLAGCIGSVGQGHDRRSRTAHCRRFQTPHHRQVCHRETHDEWAAPSQTKAISAMVWMWHSVSRHVTSRQVNKRMGPRGSTTSLRGWPCVSAWPLARPLRTCAQRVPTSDHGSCAHKVHRCAPRSRSQPKYAAPDRNF